MFVDSEYLYDLYVELNPALYSKESLRWYS